MANKTSPHILGTSASFLGFCLIIITSLHISEKSDSTKIDEFTALISLLLTFSSIFSFISMRTRNQRREDRFEWWAELMFFLALAGNAAIILYILVFLLLK
ncbi:MAG: hypothetical protein ABWZ25_18665 [Chitinophagaceae bacterium]